MDHPVVDFHLQLLQPCSRWPIHSCHSPAWWRSIHRCTQIYNLEWYASSYHKPKPLCLRNQLLALEDRLARMKQGSPSISVKTDLSCETKYKISNVHLLRQFKQRQVVGVVCRVVVGVQDDFWNSNNSPGTESKIYLPYKKKYKYKNRHLSPLS